MWIHRRLCRWGSQCLLSAFCLAFSMLLPLLAMATQNSSQELELSLTVQPTTVRRGQAATVQVRLRNPRKSETITLRATATYTDEAGVQREVASNEVQLVVDASVPIRIAIPADRVRYVPGTATFDGVPVTPAGDSAIAIDLVLPGDGQEHTLELRVIR